MVFKKQLFENKFNHLENQKYIYKKNKKKKQCGGKEDESNVINEKTYIKYGDTIMKPLIQEMIRKIGSYQIDTNININDIINKIRNLFEKTQVLNIIYDILNNFENFNNQEKLKKKYEIISKNIDEILKITISNEFEKSVNNEVFKTIAVSKNEKNAIMIEQKYMTLWKHFQKSCIFIKKYINLLNEDKELIDIIDKNIDKFIKDKSINGGGFFDFLNFSEKKQKYETETRELEDIITILIQKIIFILDNEKLCNIIYTLYQQEHLFVNLIHKYKDYAIYTAYQEIEKFLNNKQNNDTIKLLIKIYEFLSNKDNERNIKDIFFWIDSNIFIFLDLINTVIIDIKKSTDKKYKDNKNDKNNNINIWGIIQAVWNANTYQLLKLIPIISSLYSNYEKTFVPQKPQNGGRKKIKKSSYKDNKRTITK